MSNTYITKLYFLAKNVIHQGLSKLRNETKLEIKTKWLISLKPILSNPNKIWTLTIASLHNKSRPVLTSNAVISDVGRYTRLTLALKEINISLGFLREDYGHCCKILNLLLVTPGKEFIFHSKLGFHSLRITTSTN